MINENSYSNSTEKENNNQTEIISLNNLSDEQLAMEIQKGIDDMIDGRIYSADEVEGEYERHL